MWQSCGKAKNKPSHWPTILGVIYIIPSTGMPNSKPLVGMVMICYDCVYHMMFDWEKPPFEKTKGNHLKKLDWPLRVLVSRKHPISDTLLGHPIIIYHLSSSIIFFHQIIIIYHHGIISLVEIVINPTNHPKWLAIHDNDWWSSLGPGRRTRCCSCGRKGRPFLVISRWKMIDIIYSMCSLFIFIL
jgi:hypothetical protein